MYLAPFPGLDPAFLEVLNGRSRQQLLLQADGDEVALQVDHGRIQAARPIDPTTESEHDTNSSAMPQG